MRATVAIAIFLASGLGACGTDGSLEVQHQYAFATLGELDDAIKAAPDPDADGDSIPDPIEVQLGTDPGDRDTDRDGLVDNYELFGDSFDRDDPLPDGDNDGLIAPVDADDDDDGVNDGEVVDTDGDTIPNYLEFYGFTYDFLTGRFRPWNGDEGVAHFVTDPLQFSTDQDAYSDAAEASGNLLDPSVEAPGDQPLVPAYPNITFELTGYSVTLNEEVEISEGESLEKGRSWNREMAQSHSYTKQSTWEIGGSFEYGKDGPKGTVSGKYGESYANTDTTSTAVSIGQSVTSQENWSVARSTNPTDAARIKLFLKVRNRGTAPISNLVPTLTLRIGGLNIATFEPGNAQVNILAPGGTYPEEEGVYWVIDTGENGPLSLTMTELRALERGAPVSVSATQIQGDVMRLTADGGWERTGDTNEYIARCDAVCANVRIEVDAHGQFVHHLVYADDTPSAPVTKLGAALERIGVGEDGILRYVDREGVPRSVSLDGYAFSFDDDTLRRNDWELMGDGAAETKPPPGFELAEMRLFPGTTLMIRAPRDPQTTPGPVIHFAYLDPVNGEVKVSAADYEGIDSVVVTNEDGSVTLDLVEDIPGAGFYSGTVGGRIDSSDILRVLVTNLPGEVAEAELGHLFVDPGSKAPIVNVVSLDLANHRLYANVSVGREDDPFSAIDWVRAYHPSLPGGFLKLERVVNFYEDSDGYDVTYPANGPSSNVKIVAFVRDGLFTERVVTAADVLDAALKGEASLMGQEGFFNQITHRDSFDLDNGKKFSSDDGTTLSTSDLFIDPGYMYMIADYTNLGGTVEFDDLDRADIVSADPSRDGWVPLLESGGLQEGDVLAVRTSPGAYCKVLILKIEQEKRLTGRPYFARVNLRFVKFSGPVANAGGDQNVIFDASQSAIQLKGGASTGAQTYKWTFLGRPAGSTAMIENSTLATAKFVPDIGVDTDVETGETVPASYLVRLTINAGTADASSDTVQIKVRFPLADAGPDKSVSFDPDTDDPVGLDGSGSIGAANYDWTFLSRPVGSTASIVKRTTATPSFAPDVEGDYELRLTINKGRSDESTDDVTVQVTLLD